MVEEWRDIKGYEGCYQVSNLGRVRSLLVRGLNGGILVPIKDVAGYSCVNLSQKTYKIHRLVAISFIPNPNNYPCVNHKDENKNNNNIDNLEWCTYRYNNNYGTRNTRISQNTRRKRKIIQYDLFRNKIKEWDSISSAARYYNVKRCTIGGCCAKRQHTSCGYIWRYADEGI